MSHRWAAILSGTTFPLRPARQVRLLHLLARPLRHVEGRYFELIDQGYAMCLMDDGTGTGTKVAKLLHRLPTAITTSSTPTLSTRPPAASLRRQSFTLQRHARRRPANLGTTPVTPETPNNVNPQDLVAQINKVSNLIYAAFGPATSGTAARLPSDPGGRRRSAGRADHRTARIQRLLAQRRRRQIASPCRSLRSTRVTSTYPIAGSTTIVPINPKNGKAVPFYGSISHGLDACCRRSCSRRRSNDTLPRPTVPAGRRLACSAATVSARHRHAVQLRVPGLRRGAAGDRRQPDAGTTMKADDTVFYTYNASTNSVMDSTGKSATPTGGQYFVDAIDPYNPIYAVVSSPSSPSTATSTPSISAPRSPTA